LGFAAQMMINLHRKSAAMRIRTPAIMRQFSKVLFLCTGNYYRSRYAEELFNFLAERQSVAWRAFSRGVAERGSPDNVGPMSRFSLEALVAKKIVPTGAARNPKPCSAKDLRDADMVIALKEAEHRPMIENRFPDFAEKIVYWQVDDIGFAAPSVALTKIEEQVCELISAVK
jgi:protein-tyrosine phosphatase